MRTAILALVGSMLVTGAARAEEEKTPDPHELPPPSDFPLVVPKPKHVSGSIEGSVLALFIGRFSATYEREFAPQHAWSITAHLDYLPYVSKLFGFTQWEYCWGGGLELGHRWYASKRGLIGFFVGPSVLVGRYASKRSDQPALGFTTIGGALDLGYQNVTSSGVLWAIGAGVQVEHATRSGSDITYPASFRAAPVLPRILLSGGFEVL